MVNIYLEDTGYVSPTFGGSDIVFDSFTSLDPTVTADHTKLKKGRFKVDDVVTLKVTGFNFGASNVEQEIPNISTKQSSTLSVSTNPFEFSMTCLLQKPKQFANTTDLKDLPDLGSLMLMSLSNGHKDLYLLDSDVSDREDMLSLSQYINLFGKTDSGNTQSKKHLNVKLQSISVNEGVDKLSINLNFIMLWDFYE